MTIEDLNAALQAAVTLIDATPVHRRVFQTPADQIHSAAHNAAYLEVGYMIRELSSVEPMEPGEARDAAAKDAGYHAVRMFRDGFTASDILA